MKRTRKVYSIVAGGKPLEMGRKTLIMGVLNITPDSFSDGGRFFDEDAAIRQGEKLVEDGADILDIGGESTRPFSAPVSEEEEIRRVVPVIEKLSKRIPVPISIDTMKSGVAERALDNGAGILNDVSAMAFDPKMGRVAAEYRVPVILMHMKGTPKTMQVSPEYENVIEDLKSFLSERIEFVEQCGVSPSNIIVDPGIGFGKNLIHNLLIIQKLYAFADLDKPILLGASRKKCIRTILRDEGMDDIPADSEAVETGSQAVAAAGVMAGAHIVRVHNVAQTRDTLKIIDAIINASDEHY